MHDPQDHDHYGTGDDSASDDDWGQTTPPDDTGRHGPHHDHGQQAESWGHHGPAPGSGWDTDGSSADQSGGAGWEVLAGEYHGDQHPSGGDHTDVASDDRGHDHRSTGTAGQQPDRPDHGADDHATSLGLPGVSGTLGAMIGGRVPPALDRRTAVSAAQARRREIAASWPGTEPEHDAFVSYVRDDAEVVNRMVDDLVARGCRIWLDTRRITVGLYWKDVIRRAITTGTAFVACFSKAAGQRSRSYMREEVLVAVDELRLRGDQRWFLPVLLDDCTVPDLTIGGGRVLGDIHALHLYRDWESGIASLAEILTST